MNTAHPERDALAHDDEQEANQEMLEADMAQITADIQQLFTQTIRTVPMEQLSAPALGCVPTKRIFIPLAEAIDDSLWVTAPNEKLLAVLSGSDCPLVAELRQALADHWVRHWASDIAGYAP